MLSLEGLQKAVARSVLGHAALGLSPLMASGAADPYRRMRIYQNNTRSTLTATLKTVFPVTVRLVDERFFGYAANEFIRTNPPNEPRLVRYGADFPAFLRTFKGLEDLPFVSEVARLEWAIAEALDEASLPAVPIAALNGNAAETPELVLQPSLRLVISHWPVLAIWSAHQDGGAPTCGWHRRPERIALWRTGDNIRFSKLSGAEFSFRYSLAHGHGLDKAVSRALTHEPMFDLTGSLVRLFGDGLVSRVRFDDFHQIEGLPQ
ncbi:DNA-binding domain-containing protein [Mesorhizobium sp. KR9-304]|uniref:DNA-binding domain-containing protein n=1 Tax=Mesorhizobium sp. KR9-304 TaxID=3156614 RepID=UPI0032B40CC8